MDYIYEFMYCDCIYELAYGTMSIHKSARGAYNAMKDHRLKTFNEWRVLPNKYRKDFKDDYAKDWHIRKTEILP